MSEPSRHGEEAVMPDDPFAVLGLPVRRDLTDEDVRAAWRRIAAVTHPDLADGGDPKRYSAAAAAYDTLRTPFGRGEALADLGLSRLGGASPTPRHAHARRVPRVSGCTVMSVGGVAIAVIAIVAEGWAPATIALLVGAATWLFTEWGRWRWGGWGR